MKGRAAQTLLHCEGFSCTAKGPLALRRIFSSSPLQLPPLPVEATGAAGVLTTPMASADPSPRRPRRRLRLRPGQICDVGSCAARASRTRRCCHSSNSFCCRRCRRPRSPRRRGAPRASPLSRPRWSAEASGQHVLPATPASATLAGSWWCASGSSPGRADGPAGASSSSRSSSTPCRCVAPAPLP